MKLDLKVSGVVHVPDLDLDAVRAAAKVHGAIVYALPDTGITDRESFFGWFRANVPQDPPLVSARSWDAFRDSIRSGLLDEKPRRFVIVWPNSAAMGPAEERQNALDVLAQIVSDLADTRATRGRTKHVSVLVG
ncbi:barstar family protein [Pendulispora brunnea]|uniref:Barstar family protein n=1 Tax=Pendulispora brunnea TaxID=2905690 RepID=A0ABZ2KKN8_9BACT